MSLKRRTIGYIRGFELTNGYAPTFREMGRDLGCGMEKLTEAVGELVDDGLLRRIPRRARAMETLADIPVPRSPSGEPLYFVEVAG